MIKKRRLVRVTAPFTHSAVYTCLIFILGAPMSCWVLHLMHQNSWVERKPLKKKILLMFKEGKSVDGGSRLGKRRCYPN